MTARFLSACRVLALGLVATFGLIGCTSNEPSTIAFPPGTKPLEETKSSAKATPGGGQQSQGDPSEYSR